MVVMWWVGSEVRWSGAVGEVCGVGGGGGGGGGGVREAASWTVVWVLCGIGFGGYIWWHYGAEFGQQYYAGYLIEKSLAVDNVFVWAIIFSYFAVPRGFQHRVLFLGVLGALVFRGAFIAGEIGRAHV